MIFIVVHKTTVKDDLLFVVGESFYIKSDIFNVAVCTNYLSGKFFVTASNFFSYVLNEYVVTALVGELSTFSKSEGKDTPVYAVGTVTFCCKFVADVCKSAKNFLARSCLLTRRTVTGFVCEYARTELSVLDKLVCVTNL